MRVVAVVVIRGGDVEDSLTPFDLDERGIRAPSDDGIGVGCGTIPATMQSS